MPIIASDTIDLNTGPFANIDNPPTIFQDVVLRVSGSVGTLNLDSGGSIVIDIVPVPEPSTISLAVLAASLVLAVKRRGKRRGWQKNVLPKPLLSV